MIGMGMATLALVMVPLGFGLAWWLVQRLDRQAVRQFPDSRPATAFPALGPAGHPSSLPARDTPLDAAPAEVIAAVAQRTSGGPGRPDGGSV